MKTSLFLGTALSALLVTGIASADKVHYVVEDDGLLEAANEVPPVTDGADSAITAEAAFTVDTTTGRICGTIKPSTATFEASAAHIHNGAKGANGGVAAILSADGFTGTLTVNKILTADDLAKLTGDLYVNVHTEAHMDGAIRAQLSVDDDPAAKDECEGLPDVETDAGTGTGTGTGDGGGTGTGTSDAGSSGSSGAATTTDDDGGCNTSGSNGGNALALLAGLGVVVMAAARKRKKA